MSDPGFQEVWIMVINSEVGVFRRVLAAVAVMGIIAAGCSSSAESAADTQVGSDAVGAVEDENEALDAAEEQESTTPTSEADVDDASANETVSDAAVVIEGNVIWDPLSFEGEWTTTKGADLLGCDGGSVNERPAQASLAMTLRCEQGDGSGTLVGLFQPSAAGTAEWNLAITDGDFVEISGAGEWSGVPNAAETGADFRLELDIEFGQVAAPLAAHERIHQPAENDCYDGFITDDGLTEFGTADDTLQRLDLVSGELTTHGPPPTECAWWLGDESLGRRIALSADVGPSTIWFGPFDGGDWETERSFDEEVLLLSRSLRSNRLVVLQNASASVILLDATTGETVGEEFSAGFRNGRTSTGAVTSADGELIAFGGADVVNQAGQLFIVAAETGTEVARIELPTPVSAVAFDPSGDDIIAGLSDGRIVTVNLTSFETTSTVTPDAPVSLLALGVQPDGLIVAVTESGAFLADRVEGPTGEEIAIKHLGAARVRPDGDISTLTFVQLFEHYRIDG